MRFGFPGAGKLLGLRGKGYKELLPEIYAFEQGPAPSKELGINLHLASITQPKLGLFNKLMFYLKYRFILHKTTSRKGYHGGKTTDIPRATLEGHHAVIQAEGQSNQANAFDSYYLSTFASWGDDPLSENEPREGEDSPSLALRWCRRFNDDEGEVWLAVRLPYNYGVLVWPSHPDSQACCVEAGEDTVVCKTLRGQKKAKLSLTCVKPMQEWRAHFEGHLLHQQSGEMVKVQFDVTWTKRMEMFSFGTHVSPQMTSKAIALETFSRDFFKELQSTHQEHYEQFGVSVGHLTITDPTFTISPQKVTSFDVHGLGMRDRAFGMRDWGYMQRYISSYFWVGDYETGPRFNVTFASLPTLSNAKFGFVDFPDQPGPAVPIEGISGDFANIAPDGIPPKHLELGFRCNDTVYHMAMDIDEDDHVGLSMGPERMWVNFRFARFTVSWVDPKTGKYHSQKGHGGSEFGYRYEGVVPIV